MPVCPTVSVRTFDLSSQETRLVWRTKVDDRVLCSRFTTNGQHLLVGTGGRAQPYPLVLFNTERARPIHVCLLTSCKRAHTHTLLRIGLRCSVPSRCRRALHRMGLTGCLHRCWFRQSVQRVRSAHRHVPLYLRRPFGQRLLLDGRLSWLR